MSSVLTTLRVMTKLEFIMYMLESIISRLLKNVDEQMHNCVPTSLSLECKIMREM